MPSATLENILRKNSTAFHPVVPFDRHTDKLLQMDLGAENRDLDASVFGNLDAFTSWINNKLQLAGARYGVGGYNEYRGMYASSSVFDANDAGEEPRRLHLGLDIWGKAGTPVMAPLDGRVHSFAMNNTPGDYGGTIILEHVIEEISFYTLYGHLSSTSVSGLHAGAFIARGTAFASFGVPEENGYWPPHLHFQLILNMGDWKGDYPGVCKFSEREKWLLNSPDPQLVIAW